MEKDCRENNRAIRLRDCSFRPEDHLIEISFDGKEEKNLYLEVKWREVWFHIWCAEHGIGEFDREIKEIPAKLIEGTNLLQAECTVIANGKELGTGVGAVALAGDVSYAVQQAETIAKGRALANAGFGTVFSTVIGSTSGGREIPCDSGLSSTDMYLIRDPASPKIMFPVEPAKPEEGDLPFTFQEPQPESRPESQAAAETEPQAESRSAPQTEKNADPVSAPPADAEASQMNEDVKKPMTREEALRYTVPVRGKNFGIPLGDLYANNPGALHYYAETPRYGEKYPEFQKAVKLVLS